MVREAAGRRGPRTCWERTGADDAYHQHLRELIRRERVSMNQFITLAVAETMAAVEVEEHLQQRAARASGEAFEQAMAKVADVEPAPEDAL